MNDVTAFVQAHLVPVGVGLLLALLLVVALLGAAESTHNDRSTR